MKTMCYWCGKDHRKAISLSCRQLSRKMNALIRDGVPVWVIMGILDRSGSACLATRETFEKAAQEFADHLNGRQSSLGPLVAIVAAKKKPRKPKKEKP